MQDNPVLKKSMAKVKAEVKTIFAAARAVNPDIKLTNCYHLYAKQSGFKNWNVLCALIKRQQGDL